MLLIMAAFRNIFSTILQWSSIAFNNQAEMMHQAEVVQWWKLMMINPDKLY